MTEREPIRISAPRTGKMALLGYSVETMEAAQNLGREFVAVVPPGFGELLEKDGVKYVEWDFGHIDEKSDRLYHQLVEAGANIAVPLFEETVEWAGALNSRFRNDPKLFNRAYLLRDKAMMKRKAQMSGIRVGVFEEVDNKDGAKRFFKRIQDAHSKTDADHPDPVHLKPTRAAGSVGHRMIRSEEDVDELPEETFPCMVESHLDGQEFSCEAFIHRGRVWFLNINEYVHLGYTQFSPAGSKLEAMRPKIKAAVERLVKFFGIEYGVIHPEYFLDAEGELNFGEVANRVPGGHIFELIQRAYGFNPFEALLLAADPESSEQELATFFNPERVKADGYAGNVMVYPEVGSRIEKLDIPPELFEHPYYQRHNMFEPLASKVGERMGFGNHYGTIYFFGDNDEKMRETVEHFESLTYYA